LNGTLPTEIDFEQYTDDIDMEIQNHYQDMTQEEEQERDIVNTDVGNDASHMIGYVGSADLFATRDTNSDGTPTVIEEEQSITDHNFNKDIEEMDYTTTTAPTTTMAWSEDGFKTVQNGSPNQNSIRE
jgi:hypothetical protein